jgi:hypothetical protein
MMEKLPTTNPHAKAELLSEPRHEIGLQRIQHEMSVTALKVLAARTNFFGLADGSQALFPA